jgi:chromate transporter
MERPESAPFKEALLYWLKLGFISFGGPAGQISMMHQELVEKRRWISEHRFLHALNYTMVLPGPEAQQWYRRRRVVRFAIIVHSDCFNLDIPGFW